MIRLLLSDLRHHAGSWAWTAVVAVVAASAVAGQFRSLMAPSPLRRLLETPQ